MNIKDRVAREIEILQRGTKNSDEVNLDDVAYLRGCYDIALKAFNILLEDDHSGMSMSMSITRSIWNRLIDRKPLTSIEDTEDAWVEIGVQEYVDRRNNQIKKEEQI